MKARLVSRAPLQRVGPTLWERIGARLRARRTHLGLTKSKVARQVGIQARVYEAYEAGLEQAPAILLTKIAKLFGVSESWFLQDVACAEENAQMDESRPRGVYRVTTVEERMLFLVETFRKLDLDGQQHLLAIAGALFQTSGRDGK